MIVVPNPNVKRGVTVCPNHCEYKSEAAGYFHVSSILGKDKDGKPQLYVKTYEVKFDE